MISATVDQLREGFHYPTIENQPGLPTYSTINTIHTLLKKIKLPCLHNSEEENMGYWDYYLTLRHKKLTTHDFTAPNNPGSSPSVPDGATRPQINKLWDITKKIAWVTRNHTYTPSATATTYHGIWRAMCTRTPKYTHRIYRRHHLSDAYASLW